MLVTAMLWPLSVMSQQETDYLERIRAPATVIYTVISSQSSTTPT